MISNSHNVLSTIHSVIGSGSTLKHSFERAEGVLCCTRNSVTTSFHLQVASPPVLPVSNLSDVGCPSGTKVAVVVSAVSSFIKDDIACGVLCFCERTAWTMAYVYSQEVRNHDILHCQWIKDGNVLNSNPKLSATYGKCPMQTNQCKETKVHY